MVASDRGLVGELKKRLTRAKGPVEAVMANLGMNDGAAKTRGEMRRMPKNRGRMDKAMRRKARLKILARQLGQKIARVFVISFAPCVRYDVAVFGFSGSQVNKLRGLAAMPVPPCTRLRSQAVALLLGDCSPRFRKFPL